MTRPGAARAGQRDARNEGIMIYTCYWCKQRLDLVRGEWRGPSGSAICPAKGDHEVCKDHLDYARPMENESYQLASWDEMAGYQFWGEPVGKDPVLTFKGEILKTWAQYPSLMELWETVRTHRAGEGG